MFLGLVTTVKYEVNQTHRIVLFKQTNKQTNKHIHTHTLSENEQRSRSSQSKNEIGGKSTPESEVKKLGRKKIDGEVWNLDPEDLNTLAERNLSPEIIHNLREPSTESFSLPQHSKQRVSGFLNKVSSSQTKNFHLSAARLVNTPDRRRTASDGLLGATPGIFSPSEVSASAKLSESIPDSPANNPDGAASEERKQLTLELCTSEVCLTPPNIYIYIYIYNVYLLAI